MKILHKEIKNCGECPFPIHVNDGGYSFYCRRMIKGKQIPATAGIESFESIPDWCPLPDKEEHPLKRLAEEQKTLKPEYQKVINDNFEELLLEDEDEEG